jgi:hypothetical protein
LHTAHVKVVVIKVCWQKSLRNLHNKLVELITIFSNKSTTD